MFLYTKSSKSLFYTFDGSVALPLSQPWPLKKRDGQKNKEKLELFFHRIGLLATVSRTYRTHRGKTPTITYLSSEINW